MKHITIYGVLIACTALLLFTGCKARHVLIKQSDSTSVHQESKSTTGVTTHKDTGTTQSKTISSKTDSGTVETTIVPVPGQQITINKDGSFTGQASKVIIKNHKKQSQQDTTTTTEKKHISDSSAFQTIKTKKDSTHVKAKSKDVVSTPSYGWVKYLVGIIILIILIIWAYFRFKPKL